MMRHEFEERIMDTSMLTSEEYELIEYVYTWHPGISESEGKDQVAKLYDLMGIVVFMDMEHRAKKAHKMQDVIRAKQFELNAVQKQFGDLTNYKPVKKVTACSNPAKNI